MVWPSRIVPQAPALSLFSAIPCHASRRSQFSPSELLPDRNAGICGPDYSSFVPVQAAGPGKSVARCERVYMTMTSEIRCSIVGGTIHQVVGKPLIREDKLQDLVLRSKGQPCNPRDTFQSEQLEWDSTHGNIWFARMILFPARTPIGSLPSSPPPHGRLVSLAQARVLNGIPG